MGHRVQQELGQMVYGLSVANGLRLESCRIPRASGSGTGSGRGVRERCSLALIEK